MTAEMTNANGNQEARLRTLSTISRHRTSWTSGLILRRILERERAGLSLKTSVVQRDAANLAAAAHRHFGSWSQAVLRALGTAESRITVHTRETVIKRIHDHAATGLPMTTTYPLLKACRRAAVRLFGSWVAALEAAGIVPTGSPKASCPAPPSRKCIRWTKDMVIKDILNRQHRHLSTRYSDTRREAQNLISAARRLFGSWRAACEAAELSSVEAREEASCGHPKFLTKKDVLAALSRSFDAGRTPHMRDPDMRLYVSAARRFFGKWSDAVRRAKEEWSKRMLRAPPYKALSIGERIKREELAARAL